MKAKSILTAIAALGLANVSQAEVVERQYTAQITSVSSQASSAARLFNPGDELIGSFVYDSSIVGTPRPRPGLFPSHEYAYSGTVQENHITATLGNENIVAMPAPTAPSCSVLDLSCQQLPIVLSRDDGPSFQGKETDVLTLTYSLPWSERTWEVNDVAVSYVQMKFFYPATLPGSALPSSIDLGALRQADLIIHLTNRTEIVARINAMSPVPEPHAFWSMALGLGCLSMLRRRKLS